MLLMLVRHGETEHNRGRLTLGRADVPLNERGRLQAQALAASFVAPPAAIYSSPLARCRETAEAMAAATGIPVAVEPDLIEMEVGEMEHLAGEELRARYPAFLQQWMTDAADARMPGGETLREVQDRAWAAIERIMGAEQEGGGGGGGDEGGDATIVAVTHNFVIRALACRAIGLPLRDFRRLHASLAGKSAFDMGASGPALIFWNDTSHLRSAGLG